jgi:diaminopimelate decarboxylase
MVQASNYNGRCRPAEILVSGKKTRLIRRRETNRDLIRSQELA